MHGAYVFQITPLAAQPRSLISRARKSSEGSARNYCFNHALSPRWGTKREEKLARTNETYPLEADPLPCGRGSASAVAEPPFTLPSWSAWNCASPPDGVPAAGAYWRMRLVTAR